MASFLVSFPLRRKSFAVFLISVAAFCFYSALAGGDSAQILENALCFNKKFIYNRCNEAYRLNEGGDLNVPPQATDLFCNGPCLAETQGLLDCVENMFSGFMFYNKATIRDIRGTLHAACSYSIQRGNFNVGDYIQSETSGSIWLPKPFTMLYALVFMAVHVCFLLLF